MKGKVVRGMCVLLAAFFMVSLGMGLKISAEERNAVPKDINKPVNEQEEHIDDTDKKESDCKPEKKDIFTDAPEGYFEDALFVGDSRTVGLAEYGEIAGADFFATTGMSVYNIYNETVVVPEIGRVTFEELMQSRQYKKVYVMLGINELGYNRDATVKKYGELLETIKTYQPDTIFFVEGNLHVSKERSESDSIFNNRNIDEYNKRLSEFADNESVFYIDVNPLFDDGKGNLGQQYTSDNSHILAKYYADWRQWLETKAVVSG